MTYNIVPEHIMSSFYVHASPIPYAGEREWNKTKLLIPISFIAIHLTLKCYTKVNIRKGCLTLVYIIYVTIYAVHLIKFLAPWR